MKFSVVINTLDRAKLLRAALHALTYQSAADLEVIVVNGPSSDGTEDVLAEFPWVRTSQCAEKNLAKSRNVGIGMARGDVVAFLDDDAIPHPDWLQRLSVPYGEAHVGGVGGYLRDHTGVQYQCRVTVCDRLGNNESYDADSVPELDEYPGAMHYFSPTGANCSFRRDALLEIGGFDETYAYFLDETDVCLRLSDAGWKVRYAPGAEVLHKYAPSAQRDVKRIPQTLFLPARSKAYFAWRHARELRSEQEINRHLAAYSTELRVHNRIMLLNKDITKDHFDRLSEDVRRGLDEGRQLATDADYEPFPHDLRAVNETAGEFVSASFARPDHRLRLTLITRYNEYEDWSESDDQLCLIARFLSARGHRVHLVLVGASGDTLDFEDGVFVSRIAPKPPLPSEPDIRFVAGLDEDTAASAWAAYLECRRLYWDSGCDAAVWSLGGLDGLALERSDLLRTLVHVDCLSAAEQKKYFNLPDPYVFSTLMANRPVMVSPSPEVFRSTMGYFDLNASTRRCEFADWSHQKPHLNDRSTDRIEALCRQAATLANPHQ